MLRTTFLLFSTLALGALAADPGPCRNFRAANIDEDSATLSWDEPSNGAPTTGFLVHCQQTDQTTWERLAGRFFFDTQVDYTGLAADTEYVCRCRAWSIGEANAKSEPEYFFFETAKPAGTRTGLPGSPLFLEATSWTSESIVFEWTPPTDGGIATGYTVEWRSGPRPGEWDTDFTVVATEGSPQSQAWVEITGLPPSSAVQVKVKSVNAEGIQVQGTGAWGIGYTSPVSVGNPLPFGRLACDGIPLAGSVEVDGAPVTGQSLATTDVTFSSGRSDNVNYHIVGDYWQVIPGGASTEIGTCYTATVTIPIDTFKCSNWGLSAHDLTLDIPCGFYQAAGGALVIFPQSAGTGTLEYCLDGSVEAANLGFSIATVYCKAENYPSAAYPYTLTVTSS